MRLSKYERLILVLLSMFLLVGALLLFYKQHVSRCEIKLIKDGVERKMTYREVELLLQERRKVDINRAGKEALMELPGIGGHLAEEILIYRDQNGPYMSCEDLLMVRGIGKNKIEQIRPFLRFE